MTGLLDGKTSIVTGGGIGVGRGVRLVLAGRTASWDQATTTVTSNRRAHIGHAVFGAHHAVAIAEMRTDPTWIAVHRAAIPCGG